MPTTLIIGANRGIGLALAQAYSQRGDRVIGVCRSSSSELDACAQQVIENVDVAQAEGVARLRNALGDTQLNQLLICAGVLGDESLQNLDEDAFERMRRQFEVNTVGPLRAVSGLLEHLPRGSKVGLLTSRMGSIADNSSGGYYGYRASKAALNAVGRSLSLDLRDKGIAIRLLHPGFVQTRMTGGRGDVTPEQSAAGLIKQMDALQLDDSGDFRHANGDALPW